MRECHSSCGKRRATHRKVVAQGRKKKKKEEDEMALSMRRIGMLVTVVALMAAMVVATAMPAFAAANREHAPCIAEAESEAEPGPTKSRGSVGTSGFLEGKGFRFIAKDPGPCTLKPLPPPGFSNR